MGRRERIKQVANTRFAFSQIGFVGGVIFGVGFYQEPWWRSVLLFAAPAIVIYTLVSKKALRVQRSEDAMVRAALRGKT